MTLPPVTLIIPVYNERGALANTVRRVQALVAGTLPAGSEAIFVEDGSTDGTRARLAKLLGRLDQDAKPVRWIAHARNRGYGAALKTGIAAASHEIIAIADADGTYPLDELPALLAHIESGARMAVGARSLSAQPLIRRPAKAFLNAFASYLSQSRIPDINSGLRVFRREDALRLTRLLPDGFSFTSTITMALTCEGHDVVFHPIEYRERVGTSKIRPLRDLSAFTLLLCRMTLLFHPLRVFGPLGVAFLGAGVGLLLTRLFLPEPVGVATTIVLAMGGLQILAIGLLADLVNRRGGM